MERVELRVGERVDDSLDDGDGLEVTRRVDHDAAVRESGRVADAPGRVADDVAVTAVVEVDELREGLEAAQCSVVGICGERRRASVCGDGELVALVDAELQRHGDVGHDDPELGQECGGRLCRLDRAVRKGLRVESLECLGEIGGGRVRREGERVGDGDRGGAGGPALRRRPDVAGTRGDGRLGEQMRVGIGGLALHARLGARHQHALAREPVAIGTRVARQTQGALAARGQFLTPTTHTQTTDSTSEYGNDE